MPNFEPDITKVFDSLCKPITSISFIELESSPPMVSTPPPPPPEVSVPSKVTNQVKEAGCCLKECHAKATALCYCENQYHKFCAKHFGDHLISSPGEHDFQKLQDSSSIQTTKEFLLHIQYKMEQLRDLKDKVIKEVYIEICKLENSLAGCLEKIDQEIAVFTLKLNEITQAHGCGKGNDEFSNLKFLREATNFIKANDEISITKISYETIISDIYKEVGWAKIPKLQEASSKNEHNKNEIEEDLPDISTYSSTSRISQQPSRKQN